MSAIAICEIPYNPLPLVRARKARDLTIRDAAEQIGIHYVTLSNIENGTTTKKETLDAICDFYGIGAAEVIDPSELAPDANILPKS